MTDQSPSPNSGGPEVPSDRRGDAAGAPPAPWPDVPELASRHRDAVLSYARLCTATPAAAEQLAAEVIDQQIHQGRSGRAPGDLPRLPLLLTAVRDTAATWQAYGHGDLLDVTLRQWLTAETPTGESDTRRHLQLALRGFQSMPEPDRSLLWDCEVEARPIEVTARLMGADVATAWAEATRAREVFRERCARLHAQEAQDEQCRSYSKLLDAVTRRPNATPPEDLRGHLSRCPNCHEAAICLSPHGEGFPEALATAVLGWGGPAYVTARRQAAAQHANTGNPTRPRHTPELKAALQAGRRRLFAATGGLTVLAGIVVAALVLPADGSDKTAAAQHPPLGGTEGPSVPQVDTDVPAPGISDSSAPTASASPSTTQAVSTTSPSSTPALPPPPSRKPSPTTAACAVRYHLDDEWPSGFQADITVTSHQALSGWQLGWNFPDGQQITRMWDSTYTQKGSSVLATAESYNASVAAGQSIDVGFVASLQNGNAAPTGFTLNGIPCGT